MDKRQVRDRLRFAGALLFSWLYVPLFIAILTSGSRGMVMSDVERMKPKINLRLGKGSGLLYLLHNNRYFRTLVYHRIGPVRALLISWIRPGDRYLSISARSKIGPGVLLAHPYATVLNAERIGKNFSFIHMTTIGDAKGKRPIIGDNVTLGANVTIVGDVRVGDNVVIGAGSVVVKDIPSNSVAVGNPARVIKTLASAIPEVCKYREEGDEKG